MIKLILSAFTLAVLLSVSIGSEATAQPIEGRSIITYSAPKKVVKVLFSKNAAGQESYQVVAEEDGVSRENLPQRTVRSAIIKREDVQTLLDSLKQTGFSQLETEYGVSDKGSVDFSIEVNFPELQFQKKSVFHCSLTGEPRQKGFAEGEEKILVFAARFLSR